MVLDLSFSQDVTFAVVLAALAIVLLSGFTIHVLYRRPPEPLGSVLPIVFMAALVFSIGDLVVTLAGTSAGAHWVGLMLLYTGLLVFAPAWLVFTLRYTQIYAPGLASLDAHHCVASHRIERGPVRGSPSPTPGTVSSSKQNPADKATTGSSGT